MSKQRPPLHAIRRLREPFAATRDGDAAKAVQRLVRLTPEAVHDQRFSTTRLMPGYAMEEVDAFLDQVAHEMARLIRERDEAADRAAERDGPVER